MEAKDYREKAYSINDIICHNKVSEHHFFSPDTMRFFKSRVLDEVYQGPGGFYFVTSEKRDDEPRHYTVRIYNPFTGDCRTVGGFNQLTKARAITGARKLAQGN